MNLVTGATGHIGNVLVRELLAQGKSVRAMVFPGEDRRALAGLDVEVVEANIMNPDELQVAMKDVDVVFHLAAVISIMPGANEFVRKINIEGTRNVLNAAKAAGVHRMVYTSSIHALSRTMHKGYIDETVPFDTENPIGEYDRSKASASLEVLQSVPEGMDAVLVCPTGVVGPFDYRLSEMGLLFVDWMQNKNNVLIDGSFNFVDVRDVAHGLTLAAEKGKAGELYILAGEQISLITLMRVVKSVLNLPIKLIKIPLGIAKMIAEMTPTYYRLTKTKARFTPYSVETISDSTPISHEKARTQLGYNPRSLQVTIRDTVEWWKQNQHFAKLAIKGQL